MLWEILLVAACLFFLILLSFTLHNQSTKALLTHIESIKQEIIPTNTGLTSDLGELKEDILDLVHDTISKMQPPTAFDHLLGAVAAPLQAWMMRKAGIDPQTGGALVETVQEIIEN